MTHALALTGSLGDNLFDLHLSVEKIARSLIVFVFLAFALRLGGKRELGQLNVLDLAVLLLASNALQNALIGNDSSVTGGLLGAGTLFAANYAFVRVTFSNARRAGSSKASRDPARGRPADRGRPAPRGDHRDRGSAPGARARLPEPSPTSA